MSKDCIIHGMLADRALRFAAIDGTQLVRDAQQTHALSRVATAALGRQLLMTSVIATLCKNATDTVTTMVGKAWSMILANPLLTFYAAAGLLSTGIGFFAYMKRTAHRH